MTQRTYELRLSAMEPHAKMIAYYWLTPQKAAQLDPDAFLELADRVNKFAQKIRADRAQQRMNL